MSAVTAENFYDQLSMLISAGLGSASLVLVDKRGNWLGDIEAVVGITRKDNRTELHIRTDL